MSIPQNGEQQQDQAVEAASGGSEPMKEADGADETQAEDPPTT